MSNESVAAFRAKQRAAGLVQATIWVKPEGKTALQNLADQINSGKPPTPGAGPTTQTATTTPSPFSVDHNMKTWRQYAPYLKPEQFARLESKEAKPTLSVPSERPLTEGLFGPQMTILWEPNQLVYQALTYLYENFMEHWESMKFNLNLSQTNGDRREAALLIGVRPYIAPDILPNRVYIPPEGAELPDAPADWYKTMGMKPPKRTAPSLVPETTPTQEPTQNVNTQIIPDPWSDMPTFS